MSLFVYSVMPVDHADRAFQAIFDPNAPGHQVILGGTVIPGSGSVTTSPISFSVFSAKDRAKILKRDKIPQCWRAPGANLFGSTPSIPILGFHVHSSTTPRSSILYLGGLQRRWQHRDAIASWRVLVVEVSQNFDTALGTPANHYHAWSGFGGWNGVVTAASATVAYASVHLQQCLAYVDANPPAAFPYPLPINWQPGMGAEPDAT